jgi:hypothetical protein
MKHTTRMADLANSENALFPHKNGRIEKLTVPSESAPQALSNEWSCQ